jgi:tetratricopeptide (TPR) repeat protein
MFRDFNDLYRLADYESFSKLIDPANIASLVNKNSERLVRLIVLETDRLAKEKNSATYIRRGEALCGMCLFEYATEDFSDAIKLNPNSVCAYFSRAAAYRLLNKNDLGMKDYQKFLELIPTTLLNPFAAMSVAQEWSEVCSFWFDNFINMNKH